jgi:hypothetical protein
MPNPIAGCVVAVNLICSAAGGAGAALADALDFRIVHPDQGDFHLVAQDLAAAGDDRRLVPAAPGGLFGLDLGVFGSLTPTRDSQAWQRLLGSAVDDIGLAGVKLAKGLSLGLDLEARYARVIGSDAAIFGGGLRYALLAGSAATPALSVRASYSAAAGTHDLAYHAWAADLELSQRLIRMTPYAGLGYASSTLKAAPESQLADERLDRVKGYAGLRFALGPIAAHAEYERYGANDSYAASVGWSF